MSNVRLEELKQKLWKEIPIMADALMDYIEEAYDIGYDEGKDEKAN